MKTVLLMTLFMLATLAWAAAQQPGSTPDRNSGQATPSWSQKKQDSGSYGPHVSVVAFCSELPHLSRSSVTAITYVLGAGGYKTSIERVIWLRSTI